mgnify:CR=1 FL=1
MADHPDRPGYSFNDGPPPEVSRFLANKGLQPSFGWQDVEPEEHAVAFAVAKTGTVDVLTSIREEVQRAIDDGLPFREFQRNLQPRLEKLGWWGYGEALDPRDGQRRPARLGTPRRLRTIYDANLRSARAAGQWERIQRTKDALPYLEYRLGPSERHRPHHEAKEGLILPADDPFWAQWYPPNGWGCKCWIRQLTEAEALDRGVSDSPPVATREWTNRRTGEVKQVPVGIDPGWERNPGRLRQEAMERLLRDKLAAADPAVAAAAMRDMARSWMVERIARGGSRGSVPIAMIPDRIAERLNAPRVAVFNESGARHLFKDKSDRRLADLAEIGLAARAEKFALSKDERGRRALHVLIEEAETPLAEDRSRRRAVLAIFHFREDHLVLVTKHRKDAETALRRWRRKGYRLLWEE